MDDPFYGVGTAEMERRIADARLGKTNTQIARMRLIDGEYYADIGAALGRDRRTVARRMAHIVQKLGG